jgi:hypothetical protein
VGRFDVLARELTSKHYCPRRDGGDKEWPPRERWCAASWGHGPWCRDCVVAWLEQPSREEPAKAALTAISTTEPLMVLKFRLEGAREEVGNLNSGFAAFLGPSSVAVLCRDDSDKRFLHLTDRKGGRTLLREDEITTLAGLLQEPANTTVPRQSRA